MNKEVSIASGIGNLSLRAEATLSAYGFEWQRNKSLFKKEVLKIGRYYLRLTLMRTFGPKRISEIAVVA